MRQSYRPDWIITDGVFNGIYFDNGGCAEHEFGIKSLQKDFGINSNLLGIDGRLITVKPSNVVFLKYKQNKIKRAVLMYRPFGFDFTDTNDSKAIRNWLKTYGWAKLRPYDDETSWLSTAWSESDFGIYGAGDENVEYVEQLSKAIDEHDLIMYVGNPTPNNPFSRGGLVFMIASTFDESFKKDMYDADYDSYILQQKAQPYIDMVRKAKLGFYALSPRWVDKEKGIIQFWLNPRDQDNNYCGYITPGDVVDWVHGKGIVVGHGNRFRYDYPDEYKALKHNED